MAEQKKYHPTESELEILQILWDKGSSTVRQVHEELRAEKDTGYTTTLKTMQIMADKKILGRDTSNRSHIYSALVTREDVQNHFLDKVINGLFKGSATKMIIGALDTKKLSKKEIGEINDYLKTFRQ